jgi:hypothetical protein
VCRQSGSPGSGVGHNAGSVSDVKIESYSADPGWPRERERESESESERERVYSSSSS